MIQVVLSIQAGRVMPSMLLRKLSTYNRRSLLYRAFRELGRVERTLFLLRYISNTEVRRVIRAETTKIETYNEFLDWVSFGGPVIKSGDPVEQEKQLKYASLVANTIMLSNVADMTKVLSGMAADGHASHARPGRLRQPLHPRAHFALRPIRSRHGRHAATARPATASVRDSLSSFIARRTPCKAAAPVIQLVGDFRAYPQPTSDSGEYAVPAHARSVRGRTCLGRAPAAVRADVTDD